MADKPHVIVVFTFSKSVPVFVSDVNALKDAVTTAPGNTRVTIAAGDITQLGTDLTALETAQAKVDNRMGNAADRNLAWETVKVDVRAIVLAIQAVADEAPDEETAIAIAVDCGCRAKVQGVFVKPIIDAKNDKTVSGLIHLSSVAPDESSRFALEWQMSNNNTAFTTVKTTTETRTTYQTTVAVGTKLYFRRRFILPEAKGGTQGWSQVVFVVVM